MRRQMRFNAQVITKPYGYVAGRMRVRWHGAKQMNHCSTATQPGTPACGSNSTHDAQERRQRVKRLASDVYLFFATNPARNLENGFMF
jgi:hypothetical protein